MYDMIHDMMHAWRPDRVETRRGSWHGRARQGQQEGVEVLGREVENKKKN